MKLNRYEVAFWIGLIIWITETWAFGWNTTAHSVTETILDTISGSLMLIGVAGSTVITAVKIAIRELEAEL